MKNVVVLLLLLFVTLTWTLTARAQEGTVADADRLNKQFLELYHEGKYADAIPLCANIPETVLVLLINEQGEKEKGRDEREFSWCCSFL